MCTRKSHIHVHRKTRTRKSHTRAHAKKSFFSAQNVSKFTQHRMGMADLASRPHLRAACVRPLRLPSVDWWCLLITSFLTVFPPVRLSFRTHRDVHMRGREMSESLLCLLKIRERKDPSSSAPYFPQSRRSSPGWEHCLPCAPASLVLFSFSFSLRSFGSFSHFVSCSRLLSYQPFCSPLLSLSFCSIHLLCTFHFSTCSPLS